MNHILGTLFHMCHNVVQCVSMCHMHVAQCSAMLHNAAQYATIWTHVESMRKNSTMKDQLALATIAHLK